MPHSVRQVCVFHAATQAEAAAAAAAAYNKLENYENEFS